MSRTKDQWIAATGGLFANPLEQQVRTRIQALFTKAQEGGLSNNEQAELTRLLNSLPDEDTEE
jgi:hypothetical protein